MNELATGEQFAGSLGWIDLAVVVFAVGVLLAIAYFTGKQEKDTSEFFLAGRRVPASIACLSFVATEVSAVTIVSVPATGFRENWQYLQFFIGSAAARILIAFLFIPVFYKFNCTTIYEFLKHRFGGETQYAGSIFFFITRLLASGVRLYAACLGVSVILGWDLRLALLLFTAMSIAIIAFGGIKAVVWTGAFEAVVFYLVGAVVVGFLIYHIRGGLAEAWSTADQAGKLSLFNWRLDLSDPTTLWAATLNAFFVGMTVFGTDQELMQRMLTVKTRRSSQNAMVGTIVASLPLVVLYLGIGTLLYVFFRQHPAFTPPKDSEKVLSYFVVNVLPAGLKGMVLAAILLASIDSPLASLSSSFVTDIYRPLVNRSASQRHYLLVSRLGVVGFGIVLALLAYAFRAMEGILWVAFKVLAVTGGATLGVFLLGLLTRRRANRGNVVAMVVSAAGTAVLLYLSEKKIIALGWSWLIVIGTVSTFVLAYLFGTARGAEHCGTAATKVESR